jgi:GTP pyrophosphokinase
MTEPASSPPGTESRAGPLVEDLDRVALARALAESHYGDACLGTGEPVLAHASALAGLLEGMRLDPAAVAAGWLFSLHSFVPRHADLVRERCGDEVALLLANVDRLHGLRLVSRGVSELQAGDERQSQVEVLRKMLIAMVDDIRAVLVRLASRTQTLRYLVATRSGQATPYALEARHVYAPLANRLGVWQLKWELEDLSFRILDPQTYRRIAGLLDEKRVEREAFITSTIAAIEAEVAAAGIRASVSGRPKHIYSIYNKMRSKGREFDELYDLRGVRVMVDDVKDCYTVLGVIHNRWTPIPKEFDDYISRPKANDYRSLHTAVIGPDGRALEVQIRTHEMHRQAELGVAAHWRYKEGASRAAPSEQRIAWLRQVLAWRDEYVDAAQWREQARQAAVDDTVYVLTPQGRVLDLPRGSTPIDFAYHVHTDLGHRCRGAKVDGVMVPLDYQLHNGERVDIIAAKAGGPSADWLNAGLGYLASSRARAKVRQWFNAVELRETAASGRATLERELRREGRTGANLDALAVKLGQDKAEDLFIAIGRDDIGLNQLRAALREGMTVPAAAEPPLVLPRKTRSAGATRGVLVAGVDGLMVQFAKCCRPVPPDPIGGFITRGRGVSVHRLACRSFGSLSASESERVVEAAWAEDAGGGVYAVDLHVQAIDRQGLLRDISEVFSRERINVIGVNTLSRNGTATMDFTLEVSGAEPLRKATALVREVSGVQHAGRRS